MTETTTTPTDAPTGSELTTQEVLESLTGYEELGIREAFGAPVQKFIGEGDVFTYHRALIFVLRKREGMSHAQALKASLSLTVKTVVDYFTEPDESGDDLDLDGAPVSAVGEGAQLDD